MTNTPEIREQVLTKLLTEFYADFQEIPGRLREPLYANWEDLTPHQRSVISSYRNELEMLITTAKAEGAREFAEKVKVRLLEKNQYKGLQNNINVDTFERHIDQLLAELNDGEAK